MRLSYEQMNELFTSITCQLLRYFFLLNICLYCNEIISATIVIKFHEKVVGINRLVIKNKAFLLIAFYYIIEVV